jgi:thiol-disulfide isomerase/thioredoxin
MHKAAFLFLAGLTLVVAIGSVSILSGSSDEGRMPSLSGAENWLNSAPLASNTLRGKVVLVNFWTYSCINSLRELPYLKAWAEKYKDAGLVVIGVHAPEFGFEKDLGNVRDAVADLGISFPVAVDSDHKVWSAFQNQYWPANYFIDGQGRIRYHHFGEGEYAVSERVIQKLLRENGASGVDAGLVRNSATGAEAPPGEDVRSPETWAGYLQAERFVSRPPQAHDTTRTYDLPVRLTLNQWGLDGRWKSGPENSQLQAAPGKVVFRFHSRDLHMVLGAGNTGRPVRFRVTLDGVAPGEDHGVDAAPDGMGQIRQPRMYQLIRQKGPVRDRVFEIEFLDSGVEVFSFTFG